MSLVAQNTIISSQRRDSESSASLLPPLRPCFLLRGTEAYGAKQSALGLLARLKRMNWSPSVILTQTDDYASLLRELGIEFLCLKLGDAPSFNTDGRELPHKIARAVQFQKTSAGAIQDAMRTFRPDYVHVEWPTLLAPAGAAARRVGVPVFWQMANAVSKRSPLGYNRLLYHYTCRRGRILAVGNSRATARSLGSGCARRTFLHLGANADRFDPDRVDHLTRSNAGVPSDAVIAGMVGRIDDRKGSNRVLEAISMLGTSSPPIHLYLVGGPTDSDFSRSLAQRAADLGLSDRLHFAGVTNQPERHYALMDLSINAYDGVEGFGLSVVESMLMGVPVLAHALGGPAETVIDGMTGWHAHGADPSSLRDGLARALADRDRWHEMGRAARERASEHFTLDAYAARYMELARRLVEAKDPRRLDLPPI